MTNIKNLLLKTFTLFSLSTLALAEYQGTSIGIKDSDYVSANGRENIRNTAVLFYSNRVGATNSSAKLDFIYEKGMTDLKNGYSASDVKGRGVFFGTSNIFYKQQDYHLLTGIAYGNIRSRVDYTTLNSSENIYTNSVNAYFGLDYKKFLTLANLSVGRHKIDSGSHAEDLSYLFGGDIEQGKIFSFKETFYIYPYVGITHKVYDLTSYTTMNKIYPKYNDDTSVYRMGLSLILEMKKCFVKVNGDSLHYLKAPPKNFDNDTPAYDLYSENSLDYSVELGYYYEEDMLFSIAYKGIGDNSADTGIASVGVRYNF